MTWIRALAAAVFSVLLPGTGHVLLREWVRALLFAGLYVSALAIFLPVDQLATTETVTEAMTIVDAEMSRLHQFVLSFIVLFAAVDSALRAMGIPPGSDDGGDEPACPHCGRPLDEDLEFCHWCTTRLDRKDDRTAD
ncbi:zinc ribbon domain-containing protein [Natribaculum luteum]|uniref:Zinc ribbon domain-containing protein n=1 Tax=Natribaculum luteum TaxID=1586232 RepID=A0ABD5NYM1_9EURY|nr:zinc ribbon domain-containing protein [Natribaculum luteum]